MGVLFFMRKAQDAAPVIDPDAADYIARVEAAEGATMNYGVQTAVNDMFSWVEPNTSLTKAQLFRATYLFSGHQSILGAMIPFIETAGLGVAVDNGTGTYSTVAGVTGSLTWSGAGTISVSIPDGFISSTDSCFYLQMGGLDAANLVTTVLPFQLGPNVVNFSLIIRGSVYTPDLMQPRTWTLSPITDTFSDFTTASAALISSTDSVVSCRTFYKNKLNLEAQHTYTAPFSSSSYSSMELARSPIPVAMIGVGTQIPAAEGAAIRARFDQFIAQVQAAVS